MPHIARLPLLAALLLTVLAPEQARAQAPAQARVLAGRVVDAGGAGIAGARVAASTPAGADSVLSDSLGGYALPLPPIARAEWIEVRVDGGGEHYRAGAKLAADTATLVALDVVLVPRLWVIAGGEYAGDTVEVRLDRAFESWCERCSSFLRRGEGADRAGRPTRSASWPDSLFPLRVAFEPDGNPPVSPRDSLAFWAIVEAMEWEMGEELFRPVPLAETEPGDDEASPEDVVLVVMDPTLETAGYGGTGRSHGDILHATVRFREGRIFSSPAAPHLVRHEMMHALGFGHTCGWPTVVQAPGCAGLRSTRLTRDDVAYAQLLHRVTRLQRELGRAIGLESASEVEG